MARAGARRARPTIDDVAAAAGVSRGTVSRVINGGRHVSPVALSAVRRAMLETGFVPNTSARSLATGRADCVAFVLAEPQELLFEDPNFRVLVQECTRALADREQMMVLLTCDDDRQRARVIRHVSSSHVDGVMLVSAHAGDALLGALEREQVPVVACGRPAAPRQIPYVAADDRGGARIMTSYLLDRGHRRIGALTGPLDSPGGLQRFEGYCDVMGRRARRDLVVSARGYSADAGRRAMEQLLADAPDLDAVFVGADLLAVGALDALRAAGRRVPADVAVGGFDDSHAALLTDPPLTTIRQPLPAVAARMVDMLMRIIAGEQVQSIELPTELVVRGSA